MNATAATQSPPAPDASHRNYESLVRRYSRELYRYAYRLCGHAQTAEDLVQESLLRGWRARGALQDPAAARSWLYTIVRRENARRFERTQAPESELPVDDVLVGPKAYDTSTEAFVLRRALDALPPTYREPLLLQVVHGYSQQEIADRLGLSSAGVGTRLFRSREKLRAALGEHA